MKTCGTCNFWVSTQTGRAKAKGVCYRYPESVKVSADHWCGEHKKNKETPAGLAERHKLMGELRAVGVKLNMTWTVKDMKSKLEEINEKQEAEAANGQGDEEESGRTELPSE